MCLIMFLENTSMSLEVFSEVWIDIQILYVFTFSDVRADTAGIK